jgi:ABC-type multidrug transport system ATPase subunit
MVEPVLTFDHVSHRYRRSRGSALDDLCLDVPLGTTALLGPNGAGKTTLLRIATTTLRPTAGSVRLRGREVSTDLSGYRGAIGYLPQRFGFLPHLSLLEFVEHVAWMKGVPKRRVREAAERAIAEVALESESRKRMKHLSGGMARRAGIAQAIVNEPAVLFLDEPTVGLDPEQRSQVRDILTALGGTTATLLATHLTEDVAATCSRVAVLHQGRTVFTGDAAALAEGPADAPGIEQGYRELLRAVRAEGVLSVERAG